MTVWIKIQRITWLFIAVVVSIAVVCIFVPLYSKFRTMQDKRQDLRDGIAANDAKLRFYQLQQQKFPTDKAFVEQVARRAGMVKTNEALCKMVTNDMPVSLPSPAPARTTKTSKTKRR